MSTARPTVYVCFRCSNRFQFLADVIRHLPVGAVPIEDLPEEVEVLVGYEIELQRWTITDKKLT